MFRTCIAFEIKDDSFEHDDIYDRDDEVSVKDQSSLSVGVKRGRQDSRRAGRRQGADLFLSIQQRL